MNWFIVLLISTLALAGFFLLALVRLTQLRARAEATRRQVEKLYMETARLCAALSFSLADTAEAAALQRAVSLFLVARTKTELDAAAALLRKAAEKAASNEALACVSNTERIAFARALEAEQRAAYNRLAAQMPWRLAVRLFRREKRI